MKTAVRLGLMLSLVLGWSALAAARASADDDADSKTPEPPSILEPGTIELKSGTKTVRVFRPEEPPVDEAPGILTASRRNKASHSADTVQKQNGSCDAGGSCNGDCGHACGDCGQCDDCGDCCCDCGPSGNFWIRDESLLWWTRGMQLPPLVTTSPAGTPPGVLGQPTTTVLFGGNTVNDRERWGNHIMFGGNLDGCTSIEGDYFGLDQQTTGFTAASSGNPILARPFINANTGQQSSELVAFPGIITGRITAEATTDFQGGGLMFRRNLACVSCDCDDCCGQRCRRLDFVGGYRFYRLDDDLRIRENLVSTNLGGFVPVGTTFDIQDSFSSKNEFHGGDVGLAANFFNGSWSWEMLGKVAIGNNHEVVTVRGSTAVTVPNLPTVNNPGGFLALPTNIGTFTRDQVAIIPQIETRLGYQWTCHFRTFVGYNFMYWSDVARAGDQIDLRINPSQLPPGQLLGPARPSFTFNERGFWAQGLNLGAELRF